MSISRESIVFQVTEPMTFSHRQPILVLLFVSLVLATATGAILPLMELAKFELWPSWTFFIIFFLSLLSAIVYVIGVPVVVLVLLLFGSDMLLGKGHSSNNTNLAKWRDIITSMTYHFCLLSSPLVFYFIGLYVDKLVRGL
jgi:hypothetical protein